MRSPRKQIEKRVKFLEYVPGRRTGFDRLTLATTEGSDLTMSIWHWIVILFLIGLYFLPTLIAFSRDHHQKIAILLTNLFLGWSGLGWIAALIWSATATRGPVTQTIVYANAPTQPEPAAPPVSKFARAYPNNADRNRQ
jgi:hypothetical protein